MQHAPRLSDKTHTKLYLKREDMQPVFSFKLRGAYNKIASLTPEELARGVICSSAGNHAQGVALSARERGARAVICMPTTTPEIKVEAVKRLGGEVVLVGDSYSDTQTYAITTAEETGMVFVAPYDDPYVIAGQGTIGAEILRQCPNVDTCTAIFVAVGGGGLAAGVAAYVKAVRPEIKVYGVEPTGSNAMAMSLAKGELTTLARVDAFADGVAVKRVGAETFRLCQALLDGIVLVSNAEISGAIKEIFNDTRSIVEPAGAVAVAGALAWTAREEALHNGEPVPGSIVCVTSGANMNFDRLRLVSELANVGARSEAILVTTIPEQPGAFRRFANEGFYAKGFDLNVTEFKYRYGATGTGTGTATTTTGAGAGAETTTPSPGLAHVLYSITVADRDEARRLVDRLNERGMPTRDISGVEDAMVHLRHMVGGKSAGVRDEVLFVVQFPERPGALREFLDAMIDVNISMFHYRNSGSDTSSVLVGLQVPGEGRSAALAICLERLKDALHKYTVRELSEDALSAFDLFL